MSDKTVEVTDSDGAVVISITTRRGYRWSGDKECKHTQVTCDPEFAELTCVQCQRRLNPIEWVISLADRWAEVQHMYNAYREEYARLELRRRVKCDKCGEMTKVNA